MVMHACGIRLSQIWRGNSGSVPAKMEMKRFLNVPICLSATFLRTIFQLRLFLSISFWSNCDAPLSKRYSIGLNTILLRWPIIFWYTWRMESLVICRRGSTGMVLGSYVQMTIMYFFPLLDWMVNLTVLSEWILPDGISGWLIFA